MHAVPVNKRGQILWSDTCIALRSVYDTEKIFLNEGGEKR